ncbi:Choline transport protein [Cladophialophora carrionii]|uniref:Choline transport protein n=1 Tax=Cladophialophora carrionii TaxID=86049 RepID=A0A1C1CD69_9EURO|nr:Choline transport protein [Cladophialophora carrionii]
MAGSRRRSSAGRRRTSIQDDAAMLAGLGVKQELQRNFSFLSMLGLAFAILNSWTALGASMSLALPSGGPDAVIWGLVVAGICNLSLAASLAEFLSAYPTAGGQYHWVAVISWKRWVPLLSWITGWINTAGWVALTATAGLLGSQLIIGIIALCSPGYESHRWHQFLIYIGYNLFAFAVNAFLTRLLPLVNKGALIWSLTGWLVISITVLACSSPDYQGGDFVYRTFINETGWPDGLAWLLGLLQGGLGLTGFDAVAHCVEEVGNPTVVGPRIMIGCVLIGVFTGFIYLSVLLFVAKDVETVISSAAGPMLQIFYDATSNKAGSVCLLMFPLVCLLFAAVSIMTTSSRMVYAFARDGGLPASRFFAKVDGRLQVPLNALWLTTILVIIFGCIFLGSSSAFNAIVSASVVALGVTYAIPPAINCLRGRRMLPASRPFVLPTWLGWTCNLIGIAYVILTTVLFMFPPEKDVTGSNMNYCVAAFAIVLVISTMQWFIDGRKNYTGPQIDIDALKAGEIVGMAPAEGEVGGVNRSSDDTLGGGQQKKAEI